MVDVTGFSKKKEKKIIRKARVSIIAIILFFLLIIGGAMGGFYYYTQNSVYLAENEGNVALYRGIPGSLFGIEVSQLDYVTDIKVSDLQPGVANRLKEGIRADNRDAAQALINEYKEEIQSKNTGNNTTNNSNKSSSSASFPTTKGEGSTRS